MWSNWIIFQKLDYSNDTLQIKKQIGIVDDKAEFMVRASFVHPPNLQEIYEGILNGIIKRKELGLFQNAYTYYSELQLTLNEFMRLYPSKKELIIDIFQSLTTLSLTKESCPKLVIRCSNCQSYVYYTNYCLKCRNAFYCDHSCGRADVAVHKCVSVLPMTPLLFAPLVVELHSGADMGEDVTLYCEHEMKFSQKIRGMQLFSHLHKFFIKHRWMKGNQYTVEEHQQQRITFVKES